MEDRGYADVEEVVRAATLEGDDGSVVNGKGGVTPVWTEREPDWATLTSMIDTLRRRVGDGTVFGLGALVNPANPRRVYHYRPGDDNPSTEALVRMALVANEDIWTWLEVGGKVPARADLAAHGAQDESAAATFVADLPPYIRDIIDLLARVRTVGERDRLLALVRAYVATEATSGLPHSHGGANR